MVGLTNFFGGMGINQAIKYPLAFKGPKGQLEGHFDEDLVFQALQLLLDTEGQWHHSETSQTARVQWGDGNQSHMVWPLSGQLEGGCTCSENKPCVHQAALAIQTKAMLDQLPPFTNQLRQKKDYRIAFMHWLQRQSHDPYPNMARHRVLYLLNQNDAGDWVITIHKAYLNQDDQYQIKSDIDSSLLLKKNKPKFLSLTDQAIFHELHQRGWVKAQQFTLKDGDDQLLRLLLSSQRLKWRAAYRPSISSQEVENSQGEQMIRDWHIDHNHHGIEHVVPRTQQALPFSEQQAVVPVLTIQSHEHHFDWPMPPLRFHWASVGFEQGDVSFGLDDLLNQIHRVPESLLDEVAAWSCQIEKLPSIHASFEPPVAQQFNVNDRHLGQDITSFAPMLLALKKAGWSVVFDTGFHLNRTVSDDWFVSINSENDANWFDLALGVRVDGERVNLLPYLVKALKSGDWQLDQGRVTLLLDNGQHVGIEHETVQHIVQTLTELYQPQNLTESGQLRLDKRQLVRMQQLESKQIPTPGHWMGDAVLKQKAMELQAVNGLSKVPTPKGLQATLRDYQSTGLAWLQFLRVQGLGGILADDMGLGKTLQTLAHVLTEKNSGAMTTPCLVVAPTSLLGNWLSEAHTFTPALNTLLMVGKDRHDHLGLIAETDLVITSYGTLARDHTLYKDITWHAVILDEAQAIKNHKTLNAKVVKKLNAKQKLCLSGTPIENHLGELWSLFDFLMPGFLGTHQQFQQLYQWPIEKDKDPDRLQALKMRVGPLMLRRRKDQVAKELPDKMEMVTQLSLGEAQANVYESIRLSMSEEIQKASQRNQTMVVSNALLRLRQVCCHPALLNLDATQETASVKMDWLTTMVPHLVEEGRRILLFSSFTKMLALIEQAFADLGISTLKLTGQTPSAQRPGLIEKFQSGKADVFLISLKAGGAGLNLTAADTVIQFDPWWNPAAEQQAADRAHRIGQNKQVFVYQLITQGTVEEKIHNMQKHKQQLADGMWQQQQTMSALLKSQNWETIFAPIDHSDH